MLLSVPYFRQEHDHTCGPASLRMLFAMHGKTLTEAAIVQVSATSLKHGTRRDALVKCARQQAFKVAASSRGTWTDIRIFLKKGIPVLVNYREPTDEQGHYAVVVGSENMNVIFHDPWNGERFTLPLKEFKRRWLGHRTRDSKCGWMMTIEPRQATM